MTNSQGRDRQINYKTAVIQAEGMEIRVSVEFREVDTFTRRFERTGNWFSCVTDLHKGHILGGYTSGSGNTSNTPLEIAWNLLEEILKRRKSEEKS